MYTKGMLERYVDQIADLERKEKLSAEIAKIRFETAEGTEITMGRQAEEAFLRADALDLYDDLNARLLEFISKTELKAMGALG